MESPAPGVSAVCAASEDASNRSSNARRSAAVNDAGSTAFKYLRNRLTIPAPYRIA